VNRRNAMSLIPLLAVLAVAIWIVDRILLWCELRGWMTYRRTPRVRHAFGNAVLGLDALLQPGRRHVIELKQDGEVYREEDDEAARTGSRLSPGDGDSAGER
jgi:hypothetical protein